MKELFVGWQDPESRRWYTIGRLSYVEKLKKFKFVYTKGAEMASAEVDYFKPFSKMGNLYKEYLSSELFPVFANRILSTSRPNYKQHLEWLGLKNPRPLDILERTGGERATDHLQVYSTPDKTADNKFNAYFFVRGMSHLPDDIVDCTKEVKKGQKLYPMHDFNNDYDEFAVALRRDSPTYLLGYCPRYLSRDLIMLATNNANSINIVVDKINHEAPFQMRMRCKVEADWPDDYVPFGYEECVSIAK